MQPTPLHHFIEHWYLIPIIILLNFAITIEKESHGFTKFTIPGTLKALIQASTFYLFVETIVVFLGYYFTYQLIS